MNNKLKKNNNIYLTILVLLKLLIYLLKKNYSYRI